jgi:1-aminocyclopropane-1-carboxylate deaminase/D-cysteine desulfhydrase-like pyridoxal-dependent ACC family enzyme
LDDLPAPPVNALFQALPAAAELVGWMPLGRFPTRVERIEGLLPRGVDLWVKREDESAERYGGNKVRKLEFLLGEARRAGHTRIVTFGGTGSHHVAATAIHGGAQGFDVEAVLFPQPYDSHVRELLLADRAAGAKLIHVGGLGAVWLHRWKAQRRRDTAWLAGGGSSAIGTLGWVSGGFEILAQVETGALPRPDAIYCALGSCGTLAGIWWSLAAQPMELVGVRVAGRPIGSWMTRRLRAAVDRLLLPLGHSARIERAHLRVEHGFLGSGYGWPTPASRAAVELAARHGLHLDPIYTGKVMAALLADARAGRLDGKRVLFLHTQSAADLTPLTALFEA